MADKKISELDVIEFLTERKERLVAELKSIENTITGLKSGLDPLIQPNFHRGNRSSVEKQIKTIRTAVGNIESPKVEVPSEYNVSDSVDKRILFVVKTLRKANRDEILKQIKTKYEPDGDFEKLEANVKVRLSFLLKNGILKGEKKGRLYNYSLN